MTAIYILVSLLVVVCIGLISVIMLQKDRAAGLGAVGANANTGSYWSKNKGRSKEGMLEMLTKIGAAGLIILCLAISFVAATLPMA